MACWYSACRKAAIVVLAAALAAGGAGCAPGENATDASGAERFPLLVSWSFADGRTCAEAGTGTVRIRLGRPDGASASIIYSCVAGFETTVASAAVAPGTWEVLVEARGAGGVTLYRGEGTGEVSAPGEGADVVVPVLLVFTGGGD